jgi:hypothetical protein
MSGADCSAADHLMALSGSQDYPVDCWFCSVCSSCDTTAGASGLFSNCAIDSSAVFIRSSN